MEISHSGVRVNCQKDPIGGAKLALNAASGASSKNKAWGWAEDAVSSIAFKSEELAAKLKSIINDTNSNFPNTSEGLAFVESL
jgi:hypothetical protein